jgi:hypothetical protein
MSLWTMAMGSITPYRKALVLAAVAVGAGGAAWTVNGWRLGKELAEVKASQQAANASRSRVYAEQRDKALGEMVDQVLEGRRTLAAVRAANARKLAELRAAQPAGAEYACRQLPLPDTYLEKFRK